MAIADLNTVLRIFGEATLSDEEEQELFREVLLMTLARASNSDANIHQVEISTIQKIMREEADADLTEADIRKAARSELYEDANLRKYLRSVRRQLSEEDRVTVVHALAKVIQSDTEISVLEIDFFNRVADALRVTPAELAGLTN